jgi:hypothetical protein
MGKYYILLAARIKIKFASWCTKINTRPIAWLRVKGSAIFALSFPVFKYIRGVFRQATEK